LRRRDRHHSISRRRPQKPAAFESFVTHQGKQTIPSLRRSLSA
jgi:hypothetical protein